jgi:mono/diheme cytochrome c family protein
LTFGLKPTAMPSFAMRTEVERHRLIDYVMYLSLRGRTEFDVLRTLLVHGEDGLEADVATEARRVLTSELRAWASAEREVIPADPPAVEDGSPAIAESIRRGHALFLDPKGAGCASCHGDYGRDVKLQYDVWGTLVRPANLIEPLRKGGSEPAPLYRRIRGGIHAANMPAPVGLSDAQVWDIVHFLRELPHPDRLPEDMRSKVYTEGK